MAEFRLSNFTSGAVLTAAELNTGLTYASYTPTFTQSVAITKTVDFARYTQFGKLVIGSVKLTASSAGTANNKVLIGLPVTASSNNFLIGNMIVYIAAAQNKYSYTSSAAMFDSSTTMSFSVKNSTGGNAGASGDDKRFGENFTLAGASVTGYTVASGDIIYVNFQYEAA